MQKIIPNKERMGYLAVIALMAGGILYAESVVGFFTVTDGAGVQYFKVDTSTGATTFNKFRKQRANTNLIYEASDGTDVAGMNEYGVPIILDSGNSWGEVTVPAAATDAARISVTFDNVTGDTVTPESPPGYEVFLSTRGITESAGTVGLPVVGDRYANGFQILNPGLLGTGVKIVWRTVRTSNVSP